MQDHLSTYDTMVSEWMLSLVCIITFIGILTHFELVCVGGGLMYSPCKTLNTERNVIPLNSVTTKHDINSHCVKKGGWWRQNLSTREHSFSCFSYFQSLRIVFWPSSLLDFSQVLLIHRNHIKCVIRIRFTVRSDMLVENLRKYAAGEHYTNRYEKLLTVICKLSLSYV